MEITKLDAARRQLLTAIHIQWYMAEPIAAYQLAANAAEICDTLLKRMGHIRMRERIMEVHSMTEAEAVKVVNDPRNFTKHANTDPDGKMEDISPENADALVLSACMDYAIVSRRTPNLIGVYIGWYAAANPGKMGDFYQQVADALFPSISELPRSMQLEAAREVAARPQFHALLNHHKNELTDNWRWSYFRQQLRNS